MYVLLPAEHVHDKLGIYAPVNVKSDVGGGMHTPGVFW